MVAEILVYVVIISFAGVAMLGHVLLAYALLARDRSTPARLAQTRDHLSNMGISCDVPPRLESDMPARHLGAHPKCRMSS